MENLSFILAPLFSSKLLIVLFLGTLFGLVLGVDLIVLVVRVVLNVHIASSCQRCVFMGN